MAALWLEKAVNLKLYNDTVMSMNTQKPYSPILITAALTSAIIFVSTYFLKMASMYDLKILFVLLIISAAISTAVGYNILKKHVLMD